MILYLLVGFLANLSKVHSVLTSNAPSSHRSIPRQDARQNDDFDMGESIRRVPFHLRRIANQTKHGFAELAENGKNAKMVRQRIAQYPGWTRLGDALSYPELSLLRKSQQDRNKILTTGLLTVLSNGNLVNVAYYVYFFGLPSTFISEEGQMKKLSALASKRAPSATELLGTIENQAVRNGRQARLAASQKELAESALRSRSMKHAMGNLQSCILPPSQSDKAYQKLKAINDRSWRRKNRRNANLVVGKETGAGAAALLGTSQPALKAGCKYIGSSYPGLMPGMLRRGALGSHLEKLVEEDDTLMTSGALRSLSRAQLAEACCDRGFVSFGHSDKEMRKCLDSYLHLVRDRKYEPHRARLAAMALCSATSIRKEKDSLCRMLYAAS